VVEEIKDNKITVFTFPSSSPFLTAQGTYFATAIGGQVASAPPGSEWILFEMLYFWDMAGSPSALASPELIRLNTRMAVVKIDRYEFPPAPEPPAEEYKESIQEDGPQGADVDPGDILDEDM
jgi:hypothetical protein